MTDPTYRCGWRYRRDSVPRGFDMVAVSRGQWHLNMQPFMFDAMTDEEFAKFMIRSYRDTAFEQFEADLGVLARQVRGEMEQRGGLLVKDAVRRYEAAERDRRVEQR
jgi:hypothetical protein